MTVELESLPLGFRFRPTDEELVNHYLKSKISGQGSPDVHVIPEVDVSKCEPWDLPGKSLIKSDDQEWFFFAPRDRKYPNGHRSNRATAAGYWKATGKDRIIRSRSMGKNQLTIIGIKKTLVFHRGRAPRGIRTGWIMHEYRTTEPEYESGNEGGYVLYRLFNKEEERASVKDENESDEIVVSPVPERQNEGHPDINLQEEFPNLSELTNTLQPPHPGKCLTDLADSSVKSSVETPCDFGEILKETQEDGFTQVPKLQLDEVDYFPNVTSPLRPYTDHPFPNSLNQEDYMKLINVNNFSNPELLGNLVDSATNQQNYINEAISWPYEELDGVHVDDSNIETGITILGRDANSLADGNLKFPPEPLQGDAKRRIRLLINELCGSGCTIYKRNENKVPHSTGGDGFLAGKHEGRPISDRAGGDAPTAEVMRRGKLSQKVDSQLTGDTLTCMIGYSTRLALCIILVAICVGVWSKLSEGIRW